MNRAVFMKRLTELLGDVSPTERDEAIQYYNDYFDDAGVENESGVIASLGTPEELARTIKAGLNDGGNSGEFTESGFSGYTQIHKDEVMKTTDAGQSKNAGRSGNAYYEEDYYRRTQGAGVYGGREDTRKNNNPYGQDNTGGSSTNRTAYQEQSQKQGMSGGMIVLLIILAVFTSPIWIGLLGGFIGIVVGLLAALFGIFLTFLVIGVGALVVSIILLVTGISVMFTVPLGGICLVGSAFVLFAIGLVFVWLMVLMAGMAIPALVKGIVSLCQRVFSRGGVKA